MTYLKSGEHRERRTGGSLVRNIDEIYRDTFQGKLSEIAFSAIKTGKILLIFFNFPKFTI